MRLANKKILITGGGQGIGRACALRFAVEGATIIIADLVMEKAESVVKELGPGHFAVEVNVTDEGQVQAMVKRTVELAGTIDGVIHCAGASRSVLNIMEMPFEDWKRILDLNLSGTFLVCKEVGRVMAEQNSGSIVTLGSAAGRMAQQGGTPYGASKAGVEHLTRIVAMDLAPYGVRANVIAPGPVETPLVKAHSPERQARYIARIAAGRNAQPEEIANVALFLASDESSYMTGSTVTVDGGYTVGGLKEVATTTPFSLPRTGAGASS